MAIPKIFRAIRDREDAEFRVWVVNCVDVGIDFPLCLVPRDAGALLGGCQIHLTIRGPRNVGGERHTSFLWR